MTGIVHPRELVYSRSKQHLVELITRYPQLFPNSPPQYSWPDGWHGIVRVASDLLVTYWPYKHWIQIKEKFGTLRLYASPDRTNPVKAEEIDEWITPWKANPTAKWEPPPLMQIAKALSSLSGQTCCQCGRAMPSVSIRSFGGWLLPTCSSCGSNIDTALANSGCRSHP